jgi:hypothetical protein
MRRLCSTLFVCAIVGLAARPTASDAQVPAPTRVSPTVPQEYVFPSGAGVLFFHVRPDRTQDFEAVMTRLGAALDHTADPVRKQQAATWRIYRSAETPRDAVIYLFFFDPVVLGADYDPIKVLGEAAPAEVAALYERLRADVIRVERMGLQKLR